MVKIVSFDLDKLGQAQLKLGLDFTLIFCTVKIRPAMVEI